MARPVTRRRPVLFHLVVGLVLALAIAVGLWWLFGAAREGWLLLGCWLAGANVATFGYYGFDKARAKGAASRVPEVALHGFAAMGGSLGALAGMRVFRHKTVKESFRIVFWCIVALQLALVLWIAKYYWWN